MKRCGFILQQRADHLTEALDVDPGPVAAVDHAHRRRAGLHAQPGEVGDVLRRLTGEFTQVGEDKIIGSGEWMGTDGRRQVRYQVLTFRDGKIVDMQGCSSRREADRIARRA